MTISREDVLHVGRLARVGLAEDEVDRLTGQLSHIIEQFAVLQQLDTADVTPTAQVSVLKNVLREDSQVAAAPVDEVMLNAPLREGDFFRVRAVFEDS